jgi:hypothetical protein
MRTRPLVPAALVVLTLLAACGGPAPERAPGTVPQRSSAPAQASPGAGPPTGPADRGPSMSVARASHTATALPDGRVLVAGGCSLEGCGGTREAARAEFYDPGRRAFVPGPEMTTPRMGHTATALADGRVLLVGGWPEESRPPLRTAELFDPAHGEFVATDVALTSRRGGHTATRLRDGRVLIVGGVDGLRALATVELFDPATGRFRGAAPLPGPRATHGAALLTDGRVLVVGGQSGVGHGRALLDTAAVYDPARDSWREVSGRLPAPTYKLAVAALPDGGALVVGGQTADDAAARLASTALFDPRTGRFRAGARMAEPRYKISDAVVVLPGGRVAVAGGFGVDVYAAGRFTRVATGAVERQFPATAALAGGALLVTGGYDDRTRVTATTIVADIA